MLHLLAVCWLKVLKITVMRHCHANVATRELATRVSSVLFTCRIRLFYVVNILAGVWMSTA